MFPFDLLTLEWTAASFIKNFMKITQNVPLSKYFFYRVIYAKPWGLGFYSLISHFIGGSGRCEMLSVDWFFLQMYHLLGPQCSVVEGTNEKNRNEIKS